MTADREKQGLIAKIGVDLVRFQDASNRFDDTAAAVLDLSRDELAAVSLLLFAGPAPSERLQGALRLDRKRLRAVVERLALAGYARRAAAAEGEVLELTEHARSWVSTLWGPLEAEGVRVLGRESLRDLRLLARLMDVLLPMQDAHAARIAALLEAPAPTRSNRLRGGLSPAGLRRVQLFVEANLERPLHVADLASRAGLSGFHFARAFRISTGTTPRAFLESRRIEKAKTLLRESELPLAEVAAACGLGTQSRFTTTFRRAIGLTPATYRRGKA